MDSTRANYVTTNNVLTSTGVWYHIAVVRNGINFYIFVNGVSQSLTVNTPIGTNDVGNVDSTLYVGGLAPSSFYFNAWIDELRISKGIARWTTNFTPPSAPYDSQTPGVTNVGIGTASPGYLLEVNGTLQAADFYSGDGTQGLTNSTSYWLCTDATCAAKCQATIKDGLITGCP